MVLATFPGVGSGRFLRVLAAVAVAAAVLMIISPAQSDPVPGTIGFSASTSNASEGTSTHTVNVELSIGPGDTLENDATFNVTATPILATTPADFTLVTTQVTFLAGANDSTPPVPVDIAIANDTIFEGSETFTVNLEVVSGNANLGQSTNTVTILDNDDQPTLSVNSPTAVVEGSSITFTVALSNPSASTVTVDYDTANGSAVAPGDYTAESGTLTFNPGETSKPVVVDTINDAIFEGIETFALNLSSPSNATILDGSGTGTINDSDSQPTLSVNSPGAQEEGDVIEFTVTMSNGSAFPVTVNYTTATGTAVAPNDYTAASGTLTFNPSTALTRTVNVTTIDDALFEATETFTLGLSGANGASITDPTGTGEILDNDGPPGISVLDASMDEGDGVIEFQVVLLPAAGQPVTVDWATADGTATSPADFVADSGQITFAPGETSKIVPVTIIDDDDDGVDRTFSLVLSSPIPPATSIVDNTAVGTIVDDDNVAPAIGVMKTVDGAGVDTFVFTPGQTVRLTGTFTDPGLSDVHTATVNWGDGSPATVLPLSPLGTRTFQVTHSYGAAGFNTISMTVQDADGGVSDVKQAFVVIEGAAVSSGHSVGLVDTSQGRWHLYDDFGNQITNFYFGNPGDIPFMGDWNGNGIETPGLYRQSDGFVYLRNTNTVGPADIRFFFGDPGDIPIAGDFDGDGRDTLSIYRPSNQTFYIINELGKDEGGLGAAELSYVFGNPGDKPFVGDFDGDGVETVGLHRESTGFVYFRNSHTQGNADALFFFGDPGDRLIAGDWNDNGVFSPALFRPSNNTMYFRFTNTQGNADNDFVPNPVNSRWIPVSGRTN